MPEPQQPCLGNLLPERSESVNCGEPPLGGLKVLVVEDEAVIALALEGMLLDLGCSVLPVATSVATAMATLLTRRPDIALLDLELADGLATPIAQTLTGSEVPFAVMTGYVRSEIVDQALRVAPYLGKPYRLEDLHATLTLLSAACRHRQAELA